MHIKKQFKIFTIISLITVIGLSAQAFESKSALIQKGAKLTISDCIQVAIDNSPYVKKAAYNYKIAKNDVNN